MHGLEYNRLSNSEKAFFDKLFNLLLTYKTEFKFENISYEYVTKIYSAVLKDNPQLFWLDGSSKGNTLRYRPSNRTELTFTTGWYSFCNPLSVRRKKVALDAVASRIIRNAGRLRTVWEQVLYVHDYIVDNTDYSSYGDDHHNLYGCLVNKKAVCSGYSAAFQYILTHLNIPCGRITGTNRENRLRVEDHQWNYVYISGECYYIDVTWDDPTVRGIKTRDNKTHNYFCIPESELLLTHKICYDGIIPSCRSSRYNYYVYKDMYLSRYDFYEVSRIAARQLRADSSFSVKFSSKAETSKAVRELIDNHRIYKIPGISGSITYRISQSGLILTVNK